MFEPGRDHGPNAFVVRFTGNAPGDAEHVLGQRVGEPGRVADKFTTTLGVDEPRVVVGEVLAVRPKVAGYHVAGSAEVTPRLCPG